MNNKGLKISIGEMCVYLLFISIFRPVFIPAIIGTFVHIAVTLLVIVYVAINKRIRLLWNHSIVVVLSVILSSILSYLNDRVSFKNLLDGLLFASNFYSLCTLYLWFIEAGIKERLIKCLFKINLFYCIIGLLFMNQSFGIESGDYNLTTFVFGNKFTMTYLFLMLDALFYSSFIRKIKKYTRYKILFLIFFMLTVFICLNYDCSTALVASFVLPILFILPDTVKQCLFKPSIAVLTAILTAVIPFLFEVILNNEYISSFIVNVLHRTITLSGRMNIYTKYLVPVILNKLFFGYGHVNSAMRTASFYYGNAQNGLLQWIIQFGFVGAIAILMYIYICYKKADNEEKNYGVLALVYMMLLAGIVEVTYDWFLFIGLALLPTTFSRQKG